MNNESTPTHSRKRRYRSDLRAAQKKETRQRILDAVIEKLAQGSIDQVSLDEIAQAAGVGPATLYRYFPNREALWDGLSHEFNHRVGSFLPQTPSQIAEGIQRDFALFDDNPGLVQAFFVTDLGRNTRSRGRARRLNAIREALTEVTATLDEPRRTQVVAVIAYLASLQSWLTMTSEFDMSGAQVGQAVAWAIQTLLNSLEKEMNDAERR